MMRKFLFSVFLIFFVGFLFYRASDVFGQGVYTCQWSSVAGYCITVPQCEPNFQPGNECHNMKTEPECIGSFLCVAAPPPPSGGCNGVGGECRIQCLPDEENWGANPELCDQFGQAPRYCCVPKGTPKKSCGEACIDSDECPPECPACIGVCKVAPAPPPPPPPAGCEDPDAIPTAIGCINVKSPEGFVSNILTLAIGLAGGIAMLLIIFGGIQILTSAGNPEKIQAGKELITSAIAGLILIVFSVFILRIIGVEVLEIFK